jgi:hypothetical protein
VTFAPEPEPVSEPEPEPEPEPEVALEGEPAEDQFTPTGSIGQPEEGGADKPSAEKPGAV